MWMECFAEDAKIEGEDVDTVVELFLAHAAESHDWSYPESALRAYARNFAEATLRLTGPTERLSEIGEVEVRPVSAESIDDWLGFFDHDAFAGNPGWASCYCLEPHVPPTDDEPERPWRQVREAMIDRLRAGATFGYLAYVEGSVAGWVNASLRSSYGLFSAVDPGGPDPGSVIGVSCFLVAPPYRRHGVAGRLLDHVIDDAAGRGADWVEGYPRKRPEEGDAGHFRGPTHLFSDRGFEQVEERGKEVVMRLAVSE